MKKLVFLIASALLLLPSLVKAQDFPNSYTISYDADNEIIIAWPGSDYIGFLMGYEGVYLETTDGNQIPVPYGMTGGFSPYYDNGASGGLKFNLEGLELATGTQYTLHIPQGFLEVDDENWDEYVNPEINYTFTYGEEGGSTEIPVDFPHSYTTTYSDGVIIIAWPGSEYVDYRGGYDGIYLETADGTKIDVPYGGAKEPGFALYWGDGESGLEVRLNDLGLVDGTTYTLHIPEGFLEVDDADWVEYDNPEINYQFTYSEESGGTDVPVDFPNSYQIKYDKDELIIAWPGSDYIDFLMGYEGVYLETTDGNQIPVPYGMNGGFTPYYGDGAGGLKFNLEGLELVSGTQYTLHIPQGFLEVDDADWEEYISPEINYTFVYGGAPLAFMAEGLMTVPSENVIFASAAYKAQKTIDINYGKAVTLTENAPGAVVTIGNNEPVTLNSRNYFVYGTYLEVDFMDLDFDDYTGKYVVEVPAGVVQNADGEINPAQTFEYYVFSGTTSIVPTVNPAEESEVAQYSKISISWDNVDLLYLGGEAYFDNDDEEVFPLTFDDNINLVDGNTLVINVGGLAVGTYYLNIPQSYVALSDGTVNNTIALMQFNVVEGEPSYMDEGELTVPAELVVIADAAYKAQKTIDINYGQSVTLTENAPGAVVTIGSNDPVTLNARNYFVYGTYLEVDFMNLDFDDYTGKYVVEVPAGVVQNADGEVNPAQTFEYYVFSGVSKIEPTVTPADGKVEQNGEITLSWDNLALEYLSGEVYLDNDDEDVYNYAYGENFNIVDNTLVINIGEIPEGTYYLNYPQGLVALADGTVNANSGILEFTVIAETDGVVALAADADGLWVVYDLNGVNILTTADYENVMNLSAGLYIINGKKVIIRK